MDRLENLGRGAYGTVDCMRHRPTSTLMAVKVRTERSGEVVDDGYGRWGGGGRGNVVWWNG